MMGDNQKQIACTKNWKLIASSTTAIFLANFIHVPNTYAQEASVLEEVVVTARKRGDEAILDIGGSIQAISGEGLAQNGATGFDDYMRQVASLGYNNSGPGQTQIQLRGVNTIKADRFSANLPPTVGVFFDETPLGLSGYQPDNGLFDINRVEILRGPQGTLFGANSLSGAIRVIPNEPDFDSTAGEAGMSFSNTKDGDPSYSGHATLNVPVSDTLALRLVGFSNSQGGFIDNVYTIDSSINEIENYNDTNSLGGRATALWKPSDALRVKATISYESTKSDGRPDEYIPNDPQSIERFSSSDFLLAGERVDQWVVSDELQTATPIPELFESEGGFASLQIDWDVSDNLSITSVTSYSDREILDVLDDTMRFREFTTGYFGGFCDSGGPCVGPYPDNDIPVVSVPSISITESKRFSQDLRISASLGDDISVVAGLYYEDDTRDFESSVPFRGIDAYTINYHPDYWGSYVTDPETRVEQTKGIDNSFYGIFDVDTTQFSAYGEATFEVGDFDITGGLRYFDYSQDGLIDWDGWINFDRTVRDETIDENGVNPKLEVAYTGNEDHLVYASAAKGFRLGSTTQQINEGFCGEDLEGMGLDEAPGTVESDSLWNYEIGLKSSLFEGSTTLTAALFHIDWSDARSLIPLDCGWVVELGDLEVENQGIEVELYSQLSANLGVNFIASYTKSEIAEDQLTIGAKKGDRTSYAPEVTANAGFNYTIPEAFNDWDWSLRGDISYIGDMVNRVGTVGPAAENIPSSTVVNLYTGFTTESWEITFFAKNVTDERLVVGVDTARDRPKHFSRGRPLNYGISARFFF